MLQTYIFTDAHDTPTPFHRTFSMLILADDIDSACEKLQRVAPTAPPVLIVRRFADNGLIVDGTVSRVWDRPDNTLTPAQDVVA